jgi:hypothetical protein
MTMNGMNAVGYQLPVGTYRQLLNENQMTMSFMDHLLPVMRDELLPAMRELSELRPQFGCHAGRRSSNEDDAEVERLRRAVEQAMSHAKVKAAEAADRVSTTERPIVALGWQIARRAHPLADAPSWLTSARATVRVFADDTCEPASF